MCWARKVLELSSAMVEMVVLFSRRYAGYAGIGLLRRQRSNMHPDQTGHHATPGIEHFRAWRSGRFGMNMDWTSPASSQKHLWTQGSSAIAPLDMEQSVHAAWPPVPNNTG